jgi:2-oxo-3-hexenedioate decarboxylase
VRDVTMITGDYPNMDWDDAYAIQDEIKRRKEARGNKTVGLKAGLTSFAKMKQMGVETPVFGFVSDYMARPDGGEIKHSELIHPKVEAEICIVTKAPLKGPGCNVAAVMAATDFVIPAVEIIDSRYRDFKFDLKSVIADNTSSAGGRAILAISTCARSASCSRSTARSSRWPRAPPCSATHWRRWR